jgi:hypothetical protein
MMQISMLTPGAGDYEDQSPRIKRKAPSYMMSKRTMSDIDRLMKNQSAQPGPGNYEPFKTTLSGISYTMASKNNNLESAKNMT